MQQKRIDNFFSSKNSSKPLGADRLPSQIIHENPYDLDINIDHDSPNNKTTDNSPTNISTNFTDIKTLYRNDTATLPIKFYMNSQPIPNEVKNYDHSLNNHEKNNLLAFVSPTKQRMVEERPSGVLGAHKTKMFKKPINYKNDPAFLKKWLSKKSENNYSWQTLPVELVRRIMAYLTLNENAKVATVCKYFAKCYKSLFFSYDYFSSIQSKNYNAIQLEIIFANGGRLPHIKQMKNMMRGKNVGPFMKKNKLATKLSKEYSKGQKLFESFSLEPDKPSDRVLIFDKDVTDMCESSKFSLLYIDLKSCNLLTCRSFSAISNCKNLQQLTLHRCSIDDKSAEQILKNCRNLIKISLCGCEFLTDDTLKNIGNFHSKATVLELASNKSMNLEFLHEIKTLPLKRLNLGHSNLISDHFKILTQCILIEDLNVEGASNLNDSFLYSLADSFMMQSLRNLNISKNKNFTEEAVWYLVNTTMNLTDLSYSLISARIEEKLKHNRSCTFLSQVSSQ